MRNLALAFCLGVALPPVLLAPLLNAQDVSARLEGRLRDTSGASLRDVRVTVRSKSLIGPRSTRTDERGWFRFPDLPVGTYDVEARRVGYRPVIVQDVILRLGQTSQLSDITLSATPQELSALVVRADATQLDVSGTANSLWLPIARLRDLPLGRDFRQTMLLAPMATASFIGDEINLAGSTGYEHNYYVDGVNITSPIRGNTSIDLPYQFVQEMEIRTGGATASDAQVMGAVVNVVTPTGSNTFAGNMFAFYSSDALQSQPRLAAGQYQTGFTFSDVGGSYAGPVARDRLWFFAAYNPKYERRVETYPFGTIADTRRQHQFAGKLTSRVDDKTTATFTILGDPTTHAALGLAPLVFGVPQNAEVLQTDERVNDLALSLRLQRTIGTGVLGATVSQMTRLETSRPSTPAGYAASFIDSPAGTVSGGVGVWSRYWGRTRAADVRYSLERSSHSLASGIKYESLLNDLYLTEVPWQGGDITRSAANRYEWHWFVQPEGSRVDIRNPSLFVQDIWRTSSRFTLSAGLRAGRQDLVNARTGRRFLAIREGVQPRLGAVLLLGEPGSQRLFASYARAADQVAGWISFIVPSQYQCVATFTADPRMDTTGAGAQCAPPYLAATPNAFLWHARAQTTDELSMGYERRFRPGVSGTVRVIGRRLNDGVHNAFDSTGNHILGNPGLGSLARFPRPYRHYTGLELSLDGQSDDQSWFRMSYVLSQTYGNYTGGYMSDWRVPSAHFGPLYIIPEQHINANGLLPNDRTHMFKAFGSRVIGRGAALGASLIAASGTPLSEYGAVSIPWPFRGFASQRGTAGRTPWLWEGSVRASSDLRFFSSAGEQWRVLFDVQDISSRRPPVDFEQIHYTCLVNNQQACPNAAYGRVTRYAPPITARLGLEVDF